MTTPSGTELREWLDRLAIQDLITRYSDAVTRADWQQCETLFAVDAVWEQRGAHPERGATADVPRDPRPDRAPEP